MKETYSPTEISSGTLQQAELFNFAKIAGDNSEKPLHTHPGPDPVPTHPFPGPTHPGTDPLPTHPGHNPSTPLPTHPGK